MLTCLDADGVDSVALVRRRLVLAVKHVAEVAAAVVADDFDRTAVGPHTDVATTSL